MTPFTPQQEKELRDQLGQAKAINNSLGSILKTNADQYFAAMHCRVLETLLDGKPSTPLPQRGHP